MDICKIDSEEEIKIQFNAIIKTCCHKNDENGYLQRVPGIIRTNNLRPYVFALQVNNTTTDKRMLYRMAGGIGNYFQWTR